MNYKQTIVIVLVLSASGALGFLLSWHHYRAPAMVTMATYHYPTLFVNQLLGDPQAGEKIFKEYCASCHLTDPIIEVNAPAVDNAQAWQSRRRVGLDKLLAITINGEGAMPARGGCFECSDEQLRATISYMLNYKVQK